MPWGISDDYEGFNAGVWERALDVGQTEWGIGDEWEEREKRRGRDARPPDLSHLHYVESALSAARLFVGCNATPADRVYWAGRMCDAVFSDQKAAESDRLSSEQLFWTVAARLGHLKLTQWQDQLIECFQSVRVRDEETARRLLLTAETISDEQWMEMEKRRRLLRCEDQVTGDSGDARPPLSGPLTAPNRHKQVESEEEVWSRHMSSIRRVDCVGRPSPDWMALLSVGRGETSWEIGWDALVEEFSKSLSGVATFTFGPEECGGAFSQHAGMRLVGETEWGTRALLHGYVQTANGVRELLAACETVASEGEGVMAGVADIVRHHVNERVEQLMCGMLCRPRESRWQQRAQLDRACRELARVSHAAVIVVDAAHGDKIHVPLIVEHLLERRGEEQQLGAVWKREDDWVTWRSHELSSFYPRKIGRTPSPTELMVHDMLVRVLQVVHTECVGWLRYGSFVKSTGLFSQLEKKSDNLNMWHMDFGVSLRLGSLDGSETVAKRIVSYGKYRLLEKQIREDREIAEYYGITPETELPISPVDWDALNEDTPLFEIQNIFTRMIDSCRQPPLVGLLLDDWRRTVRLLIRPLALHLDGRTFKLAGERTPSWVLRVRGLLLERGLPGRLVRSFNYQQGGNCKQSDWVKIGWPLTTVCRSRYQTVLNEAMRLTQNIYTAIDALRKCRPGYLSDDSAVRGARIEQTELVSFLSSLLRHLHDESRQCMDVLERQLHNAHSLQQADDANMSALRQLRNVYIGRYEHLRAQLEEACKYCCHFARRILSDDPSGAKLAHTAAVDAIQLFCQGVWTSNTQDDRSIRLLRRCDRTMAYHTE